MYFEFLKTETLSGYYKLVIINDDVTITKELVGFDVVQALNELKELVKEMENALEQEKQG